ncbi:MAG: hypothetical protein HYZ14_14105 [Bacteroidetes bacterium]|nr:hypothetical protein [Bacteroidota bacterium]
MNLSKIHILLFLLVSQNARAQFTFDHLEYKHRIAHSELYLRDDQAIHSGVLPLQVPVDQIGYTAEKGQFLTQNKLKKTGEVKFGYRFYPLADLGIGVESGNSKTDFLKYNAGAGLGFDFNAAHFFVTAKLLPYFTRSGYTADSIQQTLNMDIGTTRPIAGSLFQRNELLIAWQPHPIFTFTGGYGKNFFGEGYRSLLLSDNASSYPFLKIETTFSSIKYVNLYTVWNDNAVNPANKSLDRMKFSSLHYLSWNITREFNLSVFESVVWQSKDTLANRGFDLNYLNPVVFYRPVEYSNGSADNVLLGLNLAYKINKHHCLYSQVIIDEFLLAQIKSDNKWWGNKWGIQLGYKSNRFLLDGFYFQTEFNVVRPFTYSHKYSVENYGHLNASVTHPIGANFYEVLNLVSYVYKDIRFTNKLTFAAYGVDTDTVNYGQNIFNSYSDRPSDFGNLIMQGLRTNVLNEQFIAEKPLWEKIDLFLTVTYNYRMQWTPVSIEHHHFLMIGLKSRIWNAYSDY